MPRMACFRPREGCDGTDGGLSRRPITTIEAVPRARPAGFPTAFPNRASGASNHAIQVDVECSLCPRPARRAGAQAEGWCESGKAVKFAGLNWESGTLLTELMQFVLAKGYGCTTDSLPGIDHHGAGAEHQ